MGVWRPWRRNLHDHLDVPRLRALLAHVQAGSIEVVTRRAESPSPFAAALVFSFNAAQMYQYDKVENAAGQAGHLDQQLLEQLVAPNRQQHLLDPRAVHQVERRLRGLGQPPRSVAEMAEWLRRLGDLADADPEGPMASFLTELAADGRAAHLHLPGSAMPDRWVSAEDAALYQQAFGLVPCNPAEAQAAGTAILVRFLATHALVGLAEVLARYPFERTWAERQLDEWARTGRAVVVQPETGPVQWTSPENLEQVQRGSLAIFRREIVTCSPPQFADFLLRWQGVHPDHRAGTAAGLSAALDRLQGLPLLSELWEQTVLPARVQGYHARWLDEWTAGGSGIWAGQGSNDGPLAVAFYRRDSLAQFRLPSADEQPLPDEAARVLECLQQRGASFLPDLAVSTAMAPGAVRCSLWMLLSRSMVTNDRFDVVRRGKESGTGDEAPPGNGAFLRPSFRALRRHASDRPEGRWSALSWGQPQTEEQAVTQASLLLGRYGIAARELALLEPWFLPWRILYEVLSRMELAGDVRRGYFVEGLSGAQFALPGAAQRLQELHLPSTAAAPVILLHSQDPANLYGSGAPFDIPLLDGGTRPLLRRPGNWLVLRAGRPVLLIEQQGKRLTALASASREDVIAAAAVLPGIFNQRRSIRARHKLTVEEWNGQPVTTSDGKEMLEAAGFVRDYQGMTLYAAWR